MLFIKSKLEYRPLILVAMVFALALGALTAIGGSLLAQPADARGPSGPTVPQTPTPTTTSLTFTPTATPSVTRTNTPTPTRTNTPTITPTPISTPTNTFTGIPTSTVTITRTNTNTPTNTRTASGTPTNTPTITLTRTRTSTATQTFTATLTPTNTLTATGTQTATPTITSTATPTTCNTNTNFVAVEATGTIEPGTVDIGNHCDDCLTTITLPFPVQLYDQSFTSANVDSNGELQFLSNIGSGNNSCLPESSFNYAIFGLWDNQDTSGVGEGVFTSVSGSAPNRIFNIEWRATSRSGNGPVNFEVRLYENSGVQQFDIILSQLYQPGNSATVGVQKGNGSLFTEYVCNGGSSQFGPGLRLIFSQPCGTSTTTPTATAQPPTSTSSSTSTGTRTSTPSNTPTGTRTSTPSNTATSTSTYTATRTATYSPTSTATFTPTSTRTNSPSSTATSTPTPTNTPTDTATTTNTPTDTRTYTATSTPSYTLTATQTPTLTGTATSTVIPARTSTTTYTPASTATFANTATIIPSRSATGTVTAVPTQTPSSTSMPTGTATATSTRTSTAVRTITQTAADTATTVPTSSSTPTRSATSAPTNTQVPCVMNFTDVRPQDWFFDTVHCLYCRGAVSGYSDHTFRPYNNTIRGQMTKIVVLAFAYPIGNMPARPTFRDVPTTDTFYTYIETAARYNIVTGYDDGTFRPMNNVTRGQLCKITAIGAGWRMVDPATPTFRDVPRGSAFYNYVETAYCHQIIDGYDGGLFIPGNYATRAQISKIVCLATQSLGECSR